MPGCRLRGYVPYRNLGRFRRRQRRQGHRRMWFRPRFHGWEKRWYSRAWVSNHRIRDRVIRALWQRDRKKKLAFLHKHAARKRMMHCNQRLRGINNITLRYELQRNAKGEVETIPRAHNTQGDVFYNRIITLIIICQGQVEVGSR